MIKSYLKVALRNILRHRVFSSINIFGLAVSLSVCVLVIMLIADQMSYDDHNSKKDNIYRIVSQRASSDDLVTRFATAPFPFSTEIMENYTGVEKIGRFRRGFGNSWVGIDENVNIPLGGFFADPEVLDLFEYELELGDPATALNEPFSVVITRKAANKLFEIENPIGEMIKVGNLGDYKVTGVIKETDHKSHILFEALASMSTLNQLDANGILSSNFENWGTHTAGWVYLQLEESTRPNDIEKLLNEIYKPHFEELKKTADLVDIDIRFSLQPITEITPGPLLGNQIGPGLPSFFIYFLAGLALIIMLSACFNYTNLSIARSLTRAREVGIRKVTGAYRYQLFGQFISEAIIVSIFALILSFVFQLFLAPAFQNLSFTQLLKWDLNYSTEVFFVSFLFTIAVGFVAGFLPAWVLSAFQPAAVLKGGSSIKLFSKINLRKALIVIQFALSIVFIISVTLVYQQLNLMVSADYGFKTDKVVNVRLGDTSAENLKTELLKQSGILGVTAASHIPAAGTTYDFDLRVSPEAEEMEFSYFAVDPDYIDNMGLELVAGRNFPQELDLQTERFIIMNETATSTLGFDTPLDAVGEPIYINDTTEVEIIGVIEDYHHQAMITSIGPMALRIQPVDYSHLQVTVAGTEAIASIETAWASINPNLKIDYIYLKDEIKQFYQLMFGDLVKIISLFSFIAICVSCLGLLGMAIFNMETRLKEISIRKVLGANSKSVIYVLSKGFIKMLAISALVALPLAFFINQLWLEAIAYRINIGAGVLIFGVLVIMTLGLLTVASQALRALRSNPIDTLRNE